MAELWRYVGRMGGSNGSPSTRNYTAGAGGWAKGDPLVASSGKLIKATAGSATTPITHIAMQDAVADAVAPAIELTPDSLISIGKSGSPTALAKYGITATTFLVDATNTTQIRVKVLGADPNDSTRLLCVSLDWLA